VGRNSRTGEKLAAEKAALETQVADLHAAAASAGSERDQLRQLQAQSTALASENAQLKTRLALVPPPARPTAAPAVLISAPTRPNAPFPAPGTTAATGPRTHIVVDGDTLAKISRLYYGTASRWQDILAANRDVLRDERSLVVGRTLIIP